MKVIEKEGEFMMKMNLKYKTNNYKVNFRTILNKNQFKEEEELSIEIK